MQLRWVIFMNKMLSRLLGYPILASGIHSSRSKRDFPTGLIAILLLSSMLLVAWSFAVPIFEAPDEEAHWVYALYLHENGDLPIYGPNFIEANQPPLYYLWASPFTFKSETPPQLVWRDALGQMHTPPGIQYFDHQMTAWAKYLPIQIVRLATIVLSVLAVLFCYRIGTEATGNPMTGLLGAGLMAFLPQFTFRGMNISNDAMVTLLSAVATYWIVRMVRRGFRWTEGIAASITMALAVLSKVNAMLLFIPFALAVLSEVAPWQTRFRRLGVLLIAFLSRLGFSTIW
jgi:Dolichyl-phosphate-mannose-protein mannosyltransferase